MYLSESQKPKRKKVAHKDIVQYWDGRVSELDLNVDFSEALTHCWACGYKKKLEAAHIIPHCLGGECVIENLVLLCKRCNLANPHCLSVEDFWNWIRSQKVKSVGGMYNTSKIYDVNQEYGRLYGVDMFADLVECFLGSKLNMKEQLEKFAEEKLPFYNISNISSRAVFYKDFGLYVKEKKFNATQKTKFYMRFDNEHNFDDNVKQSLTKYCKAIYLNGWIIEDPVNNPDICVSNCPISERKYLSRVLSQAKEGLFQVLVLAQFSDLGDNSIKREVFEILKSYNVKVYSYKERCFADNYSLEPDMGDIDALLNNITEVLV